MRRELEAEWERVQAPRRARAFDDARLLEATESHSVDELWERLAGRAFPAVTDPDAARRIVDAIPGERERIAVAGQRALDHTVDLLGSGPIALGTVIDWHRDYKTGTRWPVAYGRRIDFMQLDRPSDVKFPWELSRSQWLIPVGQQYLTTGDERYAAAIRATLEAWIDANPMPLGVNWAIAMEAAIRIVVWSWFFHVCGRARSWSDSAFRSRFLRALYQHADFVEHGLERAEVNGNHLDADAAGLVFAGLFFGTGAGPERWQRQGWQILVEELPKQVYADGVDFEASSAYHRLAFELFFLPALYRMRLGLDVPTSHADRLVAMARFAAAYTGPDGRAPLWGDNDDGRLLPLGGQHPLDHRYVVTLAGAAFGARVPAASADDASEARWLMGTDVDAPPIETPASAAFADGGVYIMRSERDHVFIDCGPVGLAGRGGHGHNDCLSLEIFLDGVRLVSDSGSYVYTASMRERNAFRATLAHNTPVVDEREQNRFVRPEFLWLLEYDAVPRVHEWRTSDTTDRFRGAHAGYLRLRPPVTPIRTVVLDRSTHRVAILDELAGEGEHDIRVPLHLAPGVVPDAPSSGTLRFVAGGDVFTLVWEGAGTWSCETHDSWISPSYGVRLPVHRIDLVRSGPLAPLLVAIGRGPADALVAWARSATAGRP